MRRLAVLFAALWLALSCGLTPAAAAPFSGLITHDASTPTGMKLVWQKDFSVPGTFVRRSDGPAEEGLVNGTGWAQESTLYGRSDCHGAGGQGAEWFGDATLCNPLAGYPAGGQFSQANGALTITMQATPAQMAAVMPLTYPDFSATCSAAANVMTCGAPGSGTIVAWATIQGTGVGAGCQITSYGTGTGAAGTYGVSCTSFASTTVTTTKAWPFLSGMLTTRQAFGFKPDKGFCYEAKLRVPSVVGTWVALWSESNQANQLFDYVLNTYGTVAQAEIDHLEHFQASGSNDITSNFHWATTPGGTYFSTNTNTKAAYKIEDGFHVYRACGDLTKIQYWADGIYVATAPVASNAVGWGNLFQYLLFDLSAGNSSAAFEGVYAGGVSATDLAYLKVWMRSDAVGSTNCITGTGDYCNNEIGDGLGPQIFFQSLFQPRFPNGLFDNGVTVTTATTVDGIPGQPIKIAVNNANFGSARQYFGTAPVAGVVSGHVYNVFADYDYVGANPSASALIGIGHSAAADTQYTMAGTTATLNSGSGCTGVAVTTVGSHKHFVCTFTAPATGNLFLLFGPLSNVNTQDVTLYQLSVQDQSPTSQ